MSDFFLTDNLTPDIKGTSLALGFFDGIHVGHLRVLRSAVECAHKYGTKSVVVTFKNRPMSLLNGLEDEFITMPDERVELFRKIGFDAVIMPDFTKSISKITADDYFNNVIMNLEPRSLSIGYNHKFGAKKTGDVPFLRKMCSENSINLNVIPMVQTENFTTVSSTYIKNLINDGMVDKASDLLIKPYSLKNVVVHGMQRGRQIGFPTANLEFPKEKIIPKYGVYAGLAVFDGVEYFAMANVGLRPTFGDIKTPLTEVNIFDFNKSLYGKTIEFRFLKKLRDEVAFPSIDALLRQINTDKKQAIDFLKK